MQNDIGEFKMPCLIMKWHTEEVVKCVYVLHESHIYLHSSLHAHNQLCRYGGANCNLQSRTFNFGLHQELDIILLL